MPLYEPIGLKNEKLPVVIDIGTLYTKIGFAGEYAPRAIIHTEVKDLLTGLSKKVFDCKNAEELSDILVDFIHNLYFRHLLVNPKDRRVVVVESLLCPTMFRETLAKVLFRHFEVSSLMYVPSHLVTLCTLGVNTALVVDVGYEETVLIPIYEGIPVLHAWQAQPLAGQAVESSLKTMLLNEYEAVDDKSFNIIDNFSHATIEDIKVRTCFVTNVNRAEKIKAGAEVSLAPDVAYRVGNIQTINISGKIRETAYEVLFHQNQDEMSVSTMILDAILKCPIDMRKFLAENMLLIGGTSMALGFKARLLSELKLLLNTSKYSSKINLNCFKFHNPPSRENYASWLGGSIFGGGTDIQVTRSLSKEVYLKQNKLPDWCNLAYNCHEDKLSL